MKYKSLLGAFLAGALFTIFLYHAYSFYQIRAVTIQNTQQIQAIINLINGAAAPSEVPSTPVEAE